MYAVSSSIVVPRVTRSAEIVRDAVSARLSNGDVELPLLPEVVHEVIAAVSDPQTDARRIADLVHRDPAIASHVLRIANSSLYRTSSPMVSLQQAVTRLGTTTLRDILLVIAWERASKRAGLATREETVRAEFKIGVTSAVFAQEIARAARRNVEGAFLAGLLHDVGRPVVLENVLATAKELDVTLTSEEEETIVDELHSETAAEMVLDWGLPGDLAMGILHHHRPHHAPEGRATAGLVAIADACARLALDAEDAEAEADVLAHPALVLLDLYPEDLAPILARRDELARRSA